MWFLNNFGPLTGKFLMRYRYAVNRSRFKKWLKVYNINKTLDDFLVWQETVVLQSFDFQSYNILNYPVKFQIILYLEICYLKKETFLYFFSEKIWATSMKNCFSTFLCWTLWFIIFVKPFGFYFDTSTTEVCETDILSQIAFQIKFLTFYLSIWN